MDTTTLLVTGIISLIIWAVIIYNIISSATRAKKIENHLFRQSLLLGKMARAAGVSAEEVNSILNSKPQ